MVQSCRKTETDLTGAIMRVQFHLALQKNAQVQEHLSAIAFDPLITPKAGISPMIASDGKSYEQMILKLEISLD
jgi:hypothetical protein